MKNAALLILVLAMLVVAGCSSNDNRTFGSGTLPEPTPEPIPRATVSARVINPILGDSAVVNADVEVTYSDGQVVKTVTDENGYFNIEIEAIAGLVEIEISKLNYAIESLVVTVNPDGTLSYDNLINGSVVLDTTGVTYMVDTVAEITPEITHLALSPDEKYLYMVAPNDKSIYRLDIQTGLYTNIANLSSNYPVTIAITKSGDTLYIGHYFGHTISRITGVKDADGPSDVTETILAGTSGFNGDQNGQGNVALFYSIEGLALTEDEDTLYVCDAGNGKIKKLTGLLTAQDASGVTVTTIAAGFDSPYDLCISGDEDTLYVVNYYGHTVNRITGVKAATGSSDVTVTLLAGSYGTSGDTGGAGDLARFNGSSGISANDTGNVLFVTDRYNYKIKKIENAANAQSASEVFVTTIAGTGTSGTDDGDGATAQFSYPWSIITNDDCTIAYISDREYGIRRMIAREN